MAAAANAETGVRHQRPSPRSPNVGLVEGLEKGQGTREVVQHLFEIEAMIDVMKDLRERFDFSAYMIVSAWEYEPDGMIDERTIRDFTDSERAYLAIFEKLRDTVDAIPTFLIEAPNSATSPLGPVGYEEAMIANVQAIECQTPPKDAAEFLTTFDAGLRPAGLVFAAEHAAHQPQR